MTEKKVLWIFLHLPKTAGSYLTGLVKQNYAPDEYFLTDNWWVYGKGRKRRIASYIKAKPDAWKHRIRYVAGHHVWYGIHELFPDREPRYIFLAREPVRRLVSEYNSKLGNLCDATTTTPKRHYEKGFLVDEGAFRTFSSWLASGLRPDDGMCYHVLRRVAPAGLLKNKASRRDGAYIVMDEALFSDACAALDKFYFIGLTEHPDDLLFLAYSLGIRRFTHKTNVSRKYARLSSDDIALARKRLSFDERLYDVAKEKNAAFKKEQEQYYLRGVREAKSLQKTSLS